MKNSAKIWILLSTMIVLSGCTFFSPKEKLYYGQPLYLGYLPNMELVMGTYINSCSPDHDTLVLTGGYGLLFFLITKDSSGTSKIIRGKWSESYPGDHVTHNTHAFFQLVPDGDPRIWLAYLHIQEKGESDVQIVIDTLHGILRMTSAEMSQAWKEHRVDSTVVKHNSLGQPYCFVKRLHLDQ